MLEAEQPVIILQCSLCRLAEPLSDRLPQLGLFLRVHCFFLQPAQTAGREHTSISWAIEQRWHLQWNSCPGVVSSHPSHLRGLLRQGDKIKSLTLEPSESIKPFWEVLRGDFGKKFPHSPEL